MRKKTGIGIIGVGGIGRFHIGAFGECADVEIVAVADVRPGRAEGVAEEHGIPHAFEDYKALLKQPRVDAVSVCLPTFLHAPVSCDALRAGKHVLCEKPPAMNVAEVRRMKRASQKARKALMFAFCQRYRPAIEELKRLIARGELGDIYYVRISRMRRRGVPGRGGWFTTKAKSGGGVLLDIGVHPLDLVFYLMGYPKPASVSASAHCGIAAREPYVCLGMWAEGDPKGTVDIEDLAVAHVRLANGATIAIETSWALNAPQGSYLTLCGTKAGADISGDAVTLLGESGKLLSDRQLQAPKADQYAAECAHFVECIRRGKRPISNVDEAIALQKLIDAIYKSAELKKQVTIR